MPCCVPGCSFTASGLVQFPSSTLRRRRWLDAIELATGKGPCTEQLSLELCREHFASDAIEDGDFRRFREPTRFTDRAGRLLELDSCRLCHRIEVATGMYPMTDMAIGTVLQESIMVQDDDNSKLACESCFAQVGMVQIIEKSWLVKRDPGSDLEVDRNLERTCCRLCHEVVPTSAMCFLDDDMTEGVPIGSILHTIVPEADWLQLICMECLAKIDLMRSIQEYFGEKAAEFQAWSREELDEPELTLEVKVEPVEIQEPVKEQLVRREPRKGYACAECGKTFRLYTTWLRHKYSHTGIKRYACKLCDEKYSQPKSLRVHIHKVHSLKEPFTCEKCGGTYYDRRYWRSHLANCNPENFRCRVCMEQFSNKLQQQDHMQSFHKERRQFGCLECGKVFPTLANLNRHKYSHTGIKRYACKFCEKKFSQSGSLRIHTRSVHTLEKNYVCEQCGESFCDSTKLRLHRFHHHSRHSELSCRTCLEKFLTIHQLQEHVRSVHEGPKKFRCLECDKIFPNYASLSRHRDTHNTTRKHPCRYCERSFSQKTALGNHIRNKHTGEAPFVCTECGKTFKDSSAYYKHRAKQHPNTEAVLAVPPCPTCGEQFQHRTELTQHRWLAHPEHNPLLCPVCSKMFSSTSTLNRHLIKHTDSDRYRCSYCERTFTQKTSLRNHVLNKHGETFEDRSAFNNHRAEQHPNPEALLSVPPCPICGEQFQQKTELAQHRRQSHPEHNPLECPVCSKIFCSTSTLNRHLITHTDSDKYRCTYCEQSFNQKTSLRNHVRNKHTDETTLNCKDCGETFEDRSTFNNHRTKQHPNPEAVLSVPPCPICGEQFQEKAELARHRRLAHPEHNPLLCPVCSKMFSSTSTLNRHLIKHTDSDKYRCTKCDRTFTQKISLRIHVRNKHTGETTFVCPDCGETFEDRSAFNKHRAKQHPNQEAVLSVPLTVPPCPICGEQFLEKMELAQHRRLAHPEHNPLLCPVCSKMFSSTSTLNRHLITHTDSDKYRCTYCEQSFNQKTSLRNHIRNRHTGETPFACESCGLAFRDSSQFYKHRAKCRVTNDASVK